MEYSMVFLVLFLASPSLGSPIPQQQETTVSGLRADEVFQAYSPTGQYVTTQDQDFKSTSRLVAGKNGQLVRAYPAAGLKRLRLVQIPQGQFQTDGQGVYSGDTQLSLINPRIPVTLKAQQQQIQPVYVQQQQPINYAQHQPTQLISPRPQKTVYRNKPQQFVEQAEEPVEEYPSDPNPQYNFSFDVKDDELTNYQNRQEERQGGVIKGSYSVVDPDGYVRTVTYTADSKNGFQAKVVREPTDVKVKFPVPTQAPAQEQSASKSKSPFRTQFPQQYNQNYEQPQVYTQTQGTHLEPTYVLRRVPVNQDQRLNQ